MIRTWYIFQVKTFKILQKTFEGESTRTDMRGWLLLSCTWLSRVTGRQKDLETLQFPGWFYTLMCIVNLVCIKFNVHRKITTMQTYIATPMNVTVTYTITNSKLWQTLYWQKCSLHFESVHFVRYCSQGLTIWSSQPNIRSRWQLFTSNDVH